MDQLEGMSAEMLRVPLPWLLALSLLAESANAQTGSGVTLESVQVAGVEREWRMYVPPS